MEYQKPGEGKINIRKIECAIIILNICYLLKIKPIE